MHEPSAMPVFDPAVFEVLLSDVGPQAAQRMIGIFSHELTTHMTAIAAAFAANDCRELAARCHAIRSASEHLGFSRFAAELLMTELAAGHGNDDAAHPGPVTLARLQQIYCDMQAPLADLRARFSGNFA
ncbi:MAG: hypothetical protein AB7G06_08875 [Bdellovibrionales bacterium]